MSDNINVPGLGPTKKTTVYLLGGVLVLVVGVGWYRSRHAASSSSSSPSSAQQQIDPATGYPTGSPEDQSALAAQSAYGAGSAGTSGPNYSTGATPPSGFTTNAQWAQAAEDYLVNTVHSGNNADVIGNALGKYITGQPLSSDQVSIVEQAIAFTGYPPVNGPTGYPPSYRTATTPPSGGGGGGSGGTSKPGKPTGLRATHIDRTSITIAWTKVTGASDYHIHLNGRDFVTVTGTSHTISHDLHPGSRYSIGVVAHNTAGDSPMAVIHVATHH